MRRAAPLTIGLAAVLLAGAVACEIRLRERNAVAEAVLAEAHQASEAYVQTFQGVHLDRELTHFAERRGVLAQAHHFWLGRNALLLGVGLLSLLAWWQSFRAKLEGLRLDVPTAADSAPTSGRLPRPAPAAS